MPPLIVPSFALEDALGGIVVGVDEAGRGPLAGPVVAAAAWVRDRATLPSGVRDSKQLTKQGREALFPVIKHACDVSVGEASVEEIDVLNILGATKLAMQRAVAALTIAIGHVLVDGNQPPVFSVPCRAVVKGDQLSLSIASASIIAKVTRDRMMHALAQEFPHYGWQRNSGYGTKAHLAALSEYGPCRHHRRSFSPVAEAWRLHEERLAA